MRVVLALILAGALTGMLLINLATYGPWTGEILVTVSDTHGIHRGDLPVIGLWVAGMIGTVALALWRD